MGTVWIAVDDAYPQNGCLTVSQGIGRGEGRGRYGGEEKYGHGVGEGEGERRRGWGDLP